MTTLTPVPRRGVQDIAAYVSGESKLASGARPIKLSANESPLGPSAKALEAFCSVRESLARYPDGSATELRKAIGQVHGLDPDRIVCGAGSDELLSLIAQAYLDPGDEGIVTAHGFLLYPIAIRAAGGSVVVAPESNLTADVDQILRCITPRTKLVFLANPNNPTGTYLPDGEVRRLRAGLPPQVLLVLDAAYCEYARRADYTDGCGLAGDAGNIVVTRTFSKAYGLAALRLGWAYCPKAVADVLNRVRVPCNVSAPAIAAGIAALADDAHLAMAIDHNERWLGWLATRIVELGLPVTPSAGNFFLMHFPMQNALAADMALKKRGIILRRVAGNGLPQALRMTVGTGEENRFVIDALAEFLG